MRPAKARAQWPRRAAVRDLIGTPERGGRERDSCGPRPCLFPFPFISFRPEDARSWRCPGQGDPKACTASTCKPHCQLPCPLDHHPSQQKRQSAGPAGRIQFLLLCIVYSIDWILAMAQFFLTVLQQYAVQVSTQFCCLTFAPASRR